MTTKQSSRTKILNAFRGLLATQKYSEITVGQIIEQAQVSKATFYRHYQRKLDVFIEMHQHLIEALLMDLQTKEDWLASSPPDSVVQIGLRAGRKGGRRATMAFQLGNEWPMAVRMLKEEMIKAILIRLQGAFSEESWQINVDEAAPYIGALYMDYMVQIGQFPNVDVALTKAELLHRFTRCILLESQATPSE